MNRPLRVITEPSIFLVGRPEIEPAGLDAFLEHIGAPAWTTDAPAAGETLVEVAGRNCYASYTHPRPGGNAAYIGHILDVGHGSVIEHAPFSFIIAGVSRSLTHELIRHRVGFSYSQLSQRFVDESDCAFVVPPAILATHDTPDGSHIYTRWYYACRDALVSYRSLVEGITAEEGDPTGRRKAIREAARSVLPNCTETRIFVTANARALRHFLALRGSIHADAEIRRLCLAWLPILKAEAPNLFADCRIVGAGTGTVVEVEHGRV